MDTSRRRSHRTVSEHRIEKLEELIGRMWREYHCDITVHDCSSCMVNVEIFKQAAEDLGIDLRHPAPF